jgi:ABC-type glycerol-3-phosphate transport system substrate-binding protein
MRKTATFVAALAVAAPLAACGGELTNPNKADDSPSVAAESHSGYADHTGSPQYGTARPTAADYNQSELPARNAYKPVG